ncbi:uncharacterized protein LOC129958742 [Argiope bruennichi]|uniref:TATA box binding protein associated factor (TAF) histone-like fold domain-containing protein n=1 Tax=Argiope bruennichi TaxID=94029 RepID=A0A8T0F1Y3_ARGBR|nr:uncharacterized protein LOC129958742 [Argiope bruennichi]KAF8784831.1 hypothetical protein HNY73_010450 [Argiope bruennichi]
MEDDEYRALCIRLVCKMAQKQAFVRVNRINLPLPENVSSTSTDRNDNTHPSEDLVSNSLDLKVELDSNSLQKLSDCEQNIRQIIRTAYQFTRHSHREKLTVKDLEKAFKIHRVDMKPDDIYSFIDKNDIDTDTGEVETETETITCTENTYKVDQIYQSVREKVEQSFNSVNRTF